MAVAKSDGVISTKAGRRVTHYEDGSKTVMRMGKHGVKSSRGVDPKRGSGVKALRPRVRKTGVLVDTGMPKGRR